MVAALVWTGMPERLSEPAGGTATVKSVKSAEALPLSGITVVDMTRFLSGPLCTGVLAALGALVVKVEGASGDPNRKQPPFPSTNGFVHQQPDPRQSGLAFLKRNRGKKSVGINLHSEGGREVLNLLVGRSDVFIHNFRPSAAQAMGLDATAIIAMNPRIAYCAIDGFGHYTLAGEPHGTAGAADIMIQALSGLMSATGSPLGPPTKAGPPIADQVTGLYAAIAIVAELLARERRADSYQPSALGVSMLRSMASLVWDESLDLYEANGLPSRYGNSTPRLVPFGVYETLDAGYIAVGAASESEWRHLAAVLGDPSLEHPRFSEMSTRIAHRAEIEAAIAEWCRARPRTDALTRLVKAGVSAAPVYGAHDAVNDRNYTREVLRTVVDPRLGSVAALAGRLPITLNDGEIGESLGPAPIIYADTVGVLKEVCGLNEEEIQEMVANGSVLVDAAPYGVTP